MPEYKPEWVKRLEKLGEEIEEKVDSKLSKAKKKPWEKRGEFVGNIVGDVIALVIFNMAPIWWPGFFQSGYTAVLAVFNTVVVIQIVIWALLILYSPKWLYYLARSAESMLSVVSTATAIAIFPFNIQYGLSALVRFGLTIALVVSAIMTVIFLVRAFFLAITLCTE